MTTIIDLYSKGRPDHGPEACSQTEKLSEQLSEQPLQLCTIYRTHQESSMSLSGN